MFCIKLSTRSLISSQCLERFQVSDKQLCKFFATKESVYRIELTPTGLVRDTNMAELTSCESLEGEAGDVMGVGFTVNALLDWINRIIANKVQWL